jgi:AhpD family alkylhydroperoxidase
LKRRPGNLVKIKLESQNSCDGFAGMYEHPGEVPTSEGDVIMQQRMPNPATLLPDATDGIQTILKGIYKGGAPRKTLELVHLRASQINGCSFCVDSGARSAKKAGETDERLFAVAAWREAPYFTDAERAALALAEAVTRLSDRSDPVPDEIYNEAAKYYDEKGLSAIILMIAMTNLFNRINVTVRQSAGEVTW